MLVPIREMTGMESLLLGDMKRSGWPRWGEHRGLFQTCIRQSVECRHSSFLIRRNQLTFVCLITEFLRSRFSKTVWLLCDPGGNEQLERPATSRLQPQYFSCCLLICLLPDKILLEPLSLLPNFLCPSHRMNLLFFHIIHLRAYC